MTIEQSEKKAWRTAAACCVAAVGCMLLPANVQSAIRATANDLLRPGQEVIRPLVVNVVQQEPTVTALSLIHI